MEPREQLQFKGSGFELFKIYIINILLTAVTFGVYSFWARVKVTRFIFQNTHFAGHQFDYHATGKEKFLGFLKGAVLITIFGVIFYIVQIALRKMFGIGMGTILSWGFFYCSIMAIVPLLIIGSYRFLLSRTSYRSLRFRFTGDVKTIYKELVLGLFLSVVTFGFYYPTFLVKFEKFMVNHSYFGSEHFQFDAKPRELLMIYLKGIILTIITLGLYLFWFRAALTRFYFNHTKFQNKQLSCNLTGGDLFGAVLFSLVVTIFTAGLGMPWAVVKTMSVFLNSIAYEGEIDFSAIQAGYDEKASALADGVSEAVSALESVTSLLG